MSEKNPEEKPVSEEKDDEKSDEKTAEKRESDYNLIEEGEKLKVNNEDIKKEDEKVTEKSEFDENAIEKSEEQKATDEDVLKENEQNNLPLTAPTEEDVLRLLKEIKTATSEIKNIVKIEISLKPESIDVIDFGDLTPDSELYVTSSLCSECASDENEKDEKEENEDVTIPSATSKTNETHSTSTETKKRWASIKRLLLFTTSRKKNK